MTQSYPTNFHTFLTRKVLAVGESIADWMEVTPAEKARLEAADAAWQRPSQSFIDLWNVACNWRPGISNTPIEIGAYNEETGYFELNGIEDIPYLEAIDIYNRTSGAYDFNTSRALFANSKIRTNLLPPNTFAQNTFESSFISNVFDKFEVIRIPSYYTDIAIGHFIKTFYGCDKLKSIIPNINILSANEDTFGGCKALENIEIIFLKINLNFKDSPKLSYDSLKYLVDNAANTTQITITVHPEVYTKLTEGDEEWRALNELALSKQITFAIS